MSNERMLDYAEKRIAALTAELDHVRRLLDTVIAQKPTGDAVSGEGIHAMASKAGFHHSYGSSIWIGGKDCTESVYRLALMAAQAENAECATLAENGMLGITIAKAIRKRWEVKP